LGCDFTTKKEFRTSIKEDIFKAILEKIFAVEAIIFT